MSESSPVSHHMHPCRLRRLILAIGIALFVLVGLFPPWVAKVDLPSVGEWPTSYMTEGFRFAFASRDPEFVGGYRPLGGMPVILSHRIDYGRLALAWLAIAILTAGAYFFLPRQSPGESPPLSDPPNIPPKPAASGSAPGMQPNSDTPESCASDQSSAASPTGGRSRRAPPSQQAAAPQPRRYGFPNDLQAGTILVGMALLVVSPALPAQGLLEVGLRLGLIAALTALCVMALQIPRSPVSSAGAPDQAEKRARLLARSAAIAGGASLLVPGLALCGVLCGARAWRRSGGKRGRTAISISLIGLPLALLLRFFLGVFSDTSRTSAEMTAMTHPAAIRAVALLGLQATGYWDTHRPLEQEAALYRAEQNMKQRGGTADPLFQDVFKAVLPMLARDRAERRKMLGRVEGDAPEQLEFERAVLEAMRVREARRYAEWGWGIPTGALVLWADQMTFGLLQRCPSIGRVGPQHIIEAYQAGRPSASAISTATAAGTLTMLLSISVLSGSHFRERRRCL